MPFYHSYGLLLKQGGNILKIVGIDAGHGGKDPGAIGPTGIQEKNITLPIALKLGEIMKRQDCKVVYTRTKDEYLSLHEREKILDDAKCDIAVSIHINASNNDKADYIATYIIKKGYQAEILATFVQRELVNITGWEDGGVREGNFHMVRETDMPAILPECGFITNEKQEKWLQDPKNQQKIAYAIGKGICDYLGIPFNEEKPNENKKVKLKFEVDAIERDGKVFVEVDIEKLLRFFGVVVNKYLQKEPP